VAGLSFEIKDATSARETAIERAVERARRDAAIAARAAGGTVAGLLELSLSSDETAPPRPMMMEGMAMRADAVPTPISEGTQAVTVRVTTRWEFTRDPR